MKNYKAIQWLLNELPELRKNGILSPESGENLERYYKEQIASAPSAQSYLLRGILLIGALMMAGGVILLTAHNWDMLPKAGKIYITFTPFTIFAVLGILTLVRGWNQACREVSALLISAGIATLVALVSQIYHINGTMFEYLTLVLALTLPLIYIFNAICWGSLFAVALFWYAISAFSLPDGSHWQIPLAYALLWVPFVVWTLWKSESEERKNAIRIFSLFAAGALMLLSIQIKSSDIIFFLFPMASTFFLLSGLQSREIQKGLSNTWFSVGYLASTGWLLFYTLAPDVKLAKGFLTHPYFWITWGLFLAGSIFYLWRGRSRTNILFFLLPFSIFLLFWRNSPFIFMGCLILSGCIFCNMGFRRRSLPLLNMGFMQIVALILCRIFDSQYSIMARAVVFIITGFAFLLLNHFLSRYFKKEEAQHEKA